MGWYPCLACASCGESCANSWLLVDTRLQRGWRPVPTDSGTKAEVAVLWSQEPVLVWLSGTETDALAGQGHRHLLDPCALCWGLEAPSWRASTVALAWLAALGM